MAREGAPSLQAKLTAPDHGRNQPNRQGPRASISRGRAHSGLPFFFGFVPGLGPELVLLGSRLVRVQRIDILRVHAAERFDLMDDLIRHPAPGLVTQPVPDPPADHGHEHGERHEQISGHRFSKLLNQESRKPRRACCNMSRSTLDGIPRRLPKWQILRDKSAKMANSRNGTLTSWRCPSTVRSHRHHYRSTGRRRLRGPRSWYGTCGIGWRRWVSADPPRLAAPSPQNPHPDRDEPAAGVVPVVERRGLPRNNPVQV